jgi:hypothetical protein
MAYLSTNEFPGTGAIMQVEINFAGNRPGTSSGVPPYFKIADVKAVRVVQPTATTPGSEIAVALTAININTFRTAVAIPVGQVLRVYRESESTYGLVDFQALQTVTEDNLDTLAKQTLFVSMEAKDAAGVAGDTASKAVNLSITANSTAAVAVQTANTAVNTANNAVATANSASAKSDSAVNTANSAANVANLANEASLAAVEASNEAIVKVDTAVAEVNSIVHSATDRFLPPAASNPATRPDGTALQAGDRYLNTTTGVEFLFKNGAWAANNVDGADIANAGDPNLGAKLVGYDGTSVTDQLNLARKVSSYSQLRAYQGQATRFEVTDFLTAGTFQQVDPAGFVEDGGINILLSNGVAVSRENVDDVYVEWFGGGKGKTRAQNKAAFNAATAAANRLGLGRVNLRGTTYALPSDGFTSYATVLVDGNGKKSTTLDIAPGTANVAIDILAGSGSYNEGGVTNLTLYQSGLSGSIGLAGIRTPEGDNGFLSAQKYNFDGLGFQGQSWSKYIALGDCSQASMRWMEMRGAYQPGATDTGQLDCVGIALNGTRGVVRVDMTGTAIIGVRRGVTIGDFVEGVWTDKMEITNCWSGITSVGNSKPGGFIDNLHVSANKECFNLPGRRDMQLGKIQCYRSTGMFAHGTGWKGLTLNGSSRIQADSVELRNTVVDAGEQIGVQLMGCDKVNITKMMFGESGAITHAVDVQDCTRVYVDSIIGDGIPTWVRYTGTSAALFNNVIVDKIITDSASVGAAPFVLNGTFDKATVKLPRFSCINDYTESPNYAAATTVTFVPRLSSPAQKISVTGTVTVTVNLNHLLALKGDTFDVRVTIAGVAGIVNFVSLQNNATIATVMGVAGTNTLRNLRFRHNGAGWVVDSIVTTL